MKQLHAFSACSWAIRDRHFHEHGLGPGEGGPGWRAARAAFHPGYNQTKNAEDCVMRLAKWASSGLAIVMALLLASAASPAHGQASATVFEGARIIIGDGSAIE